MARGVNKVILIGNLGADPETRYAPSGTAITNVRLATTDSRRDKETGEFVDTTEWHRVVFFGRTAEVAQEYLRKGSQIFVEGRIKTNKWQDRDGNDRYTTEIIADQMQMLGGRGGGASAPPMDSGGSSRPAAKPQPAAEFEDDEIPF